MAESRFLSQIVIASRNILAVVFHQSPEHLTGWYRIAIVVFYGLELELTWLEL